MTIRNLEYLMKPGSVALIGASRKPNSIGAVVARNLFNSGFGGPIMPVHPKERAIEGVLTYNSVEALPVVADLAVICTPPDTIPGLIDQLGRRGTKAAVVITAGFGETGAEGKALQQKMLDAAQPYMMRLLGPNCLGMMIPGHGLNASFVHVPPRKGDVALVAQSGAVLTAIVDWASAREIGFSHLISMGNMADMDFGDVIDYLATDGSVRAILLYVEAITNTRKFMSAARAAARQKPVIVIKAGRSEEAAKAASSHTGALAGADAVYDAAFRRAGILRVRELGELFDAVETLAMGVNLGAWHSHTGRLAIITNGGGMGVLATDSLNAVGGRLSKLQPDTVEALNKVLPSVWSHGNPVDIIGDASAKRYTEALEIVLKDPGHDAILVLNCPTAVGDSYWAAQAVIEVMAKQTGPRKPVVMTSWVGEGTAVESRRLFSAHRVPTYDTPDQAVRAFMHLVQYHHNQEMLMETPASVPEHFSPNDTLVRRIIHKVLEEGRAWLTEIEAKDVLAAYEVPVVKTRRAADPEAAAKAAGEIGGLVAIKILSPDITHKSDIGGVVLGLNGPDQVRQAATRMLETIRKVRPDAKIEGFSVQQMVSRGEAHELILGMVEDSLFGPVLLFGQGGTSVEVVADKALALPPLNMALAKEMMSQTRVWRLMQGYRGQKAAALDAVAMCLIKVSQLIIDFPEIEELDINPLIADADRVLGLDARIKVRKAADQDGHKRLAISPYPKQLEEIVRLKDGRWFLLRPIRPEDEPLVHAMFEHMTPEDIRLRFFAPMKQLSHQAAARLTQIDYDREMGLVAVAPGVTGMGEEMFGVVRIAADPNNLKAEYAVMVRSDLKGHGLGYLLMNKIISYARSRGLTEIFGEVLRENANMLQVCDDLGFTRHDNPDDSAVVEVSMKL